MYYLKYDVLTWIGYLTRRIAVTIGTSAALRVVLDADAMKTAKVPKGLWCYRIGKDHVLLGGALSDGGSVYKFFRESLRLSDEGTCNLYFVS